ncbi:MAG: hypothetical protein J6J44_05320 [Lachnospiraceae bacterium]|nr:hypothetical protein [Lachnospiraceae bacterium]MBP3593928.1 hypothetical protein [Lachnospiraceae bacterium]
MDLDYQGFVQWFESLRFYKEYMSKFPEPLCNPAFASLVVAVAVLCVVWSIVEGIRNWRLRCRIRRKTRRLEEKRIENQLKEESAVKQKNELDEYMRFMMLAQLQNMSSLQSLTFEQWRGNLATVPAVYREMEVVKHSKEVQPEEQITQKTSVVQETMQISDDLQVNEDSQIQEEPLYITTPIDETNLPKLLKDEAESKSEEPEEIVTGESVTLLTVEQPQEESPEKLTEEQQSDFAKLIAMMQAQDKQKEQIGIYNQKKTEIVSQNIELLNKGLQEEAVNAGKKSKSQLSEDALEARKKEALAAMEAEQKKKVKKQRNGG